MPTTLESTIATGTYNLDAAHSTIGFVARHAMVTKVRGSFNDFEGSGYFDADDPAKSHLRLTIQARSIDTRNGDRDAHLRGNDFFEMDQHPTITFTSSAIRQLTNREYQVTGDLTVKGVTKSVVVDFEFTGTAIDPYKNERIGLEGHTTVNRKDFGLVWNAPLETGGVLIGEKVTLEFDLSAFKNPPQA